MVGADRRLRALTELEVDQRPELWGAASVAKGPDPDAPQVSVDHQVVLVPQRRHVVVVHLAIAAVGRARPRVPLGASLRVDLVAVRVIVAVATKRPLGDCVEIPVGLPYRPRWSRGVGWGVARRIAAEALLTSVVGNPHAHLRRR